MPILNYTTKISAHTTVSQIQTILAKAGSKAVSIDYDDNHEPIAIMFLVDVKDSNIGFRLPTNYLGVLKKLENDKQVPKRSRNESQARRVAWRITKDWVEAQMAIIEADQAELAEVFLPYVVMPSGKSLYDEFTSRNYLLEGGEIDE